LLAACGNSVLQNENTNQNQQKENTNQNQQKENTELSLSMKRSFCFGECPIYDLTIQSNGKVIFEGKKYTKTIGKTESKLEKEKIKQLITEIEKANFFSLDNAYNYDSNNCPLYVSDSSSVLLSIKLNGKEKTINHDWGRWENDRPTQNDSTDIKIEKDWSPNDIKLEKDWSPKVFPQQLYNLENKIDEIVETKRWIGERK
jgi:hypothetical protein